MQILTQLLPKQLSDSMELACCEVSDRYSDGVLTRDEKVVWNSFESTSRRSEYLSSRWLIRQMAMRMNMNPDCFRLKKDDDGCPFGVYNATRYFVSIAHSNGDTVCAVSPTMKIGVDLEPHDRSVSDRLRARLLNVSEQDLLAGEPTIRLWTLKEAVLKLSGSGLRTNLKDWVIVSKNKASFIAEYKQKEQVHIVSFFYQKNWISIAYNL